MSQRPKRSPQAIAAQEAAAREATAEERRKEQEADARSAVSAIVAGLYARVALQCCAPPSEVSLALRSTLELLEPAILATCALKIDIRRKS